MVDETSNPKEEIKKQEQEIKTLSQRLREIKSQPKTKRIYISGELYNILNEYRTGYFFPTINVFLEALFEVKSPRLEKIMRRREIWKLERELKEKANEKYRRRQELKKEREIEKLQILRRRLEKWAEGDRNLFRDK